MSNRRQSNVTSSDQHAGKPFTYAQLAAQAKQKATPPPPNATPPPQQPPQTNATTSSALTQASVSGNAGVVPAPIAVKEPAQTKEVQAPSPASEKLNVVTPAKPAVVSTGLNFANAAAKLPPTPAVVVPPPQPAVKPTPARNVSPAVYGALFAGNFFSPVHMPQSNYSSAARRSPALGPQRTTGPAVSPQPSQSSLSQQQTQKSSVDVKLPERKTSTGGTIQFGSLPQAQPPQTSGPTSERSSRQTSAATSPVTSPPIKAQSLTEQKPAKPTLASIAAAAAAKPPPQPAVPAKRLVAPTPPPAAARAEPARTVSAPPPPPEPTEPEKPAPTPPAAAPSKQPVPSASLGAWSKPIQVHHKSKLNQETSASSSRENSNPSSPPNGPVAMTASAKKADAPEPPKAEEAPKVAASAPPAQQAYNAQVRNVQQQKATTAAPVMQAPTWGPQAPRPPNSNSQNKPQQPSQQQPQQQPQPNPMQPGMQPVQMSPHMMAGSPSMMPGMPMAGSPHMQQAWPAGYPMQYSFPPNYDQSAYMQQMQQMQMMYAANQFRNMQAGGAGMMPGMPMPGMMMPGMTPLQMPTAIPGSPNVLAAVPPQTRAVPQPTYTPPPKQNRAIKIVNPHTGEAVQPITPSKTPAPEEKKEAKKEAVPDFKIEKTENRAIPIVKPDVSKPATETVPEVKEDKKEEVEEPAKVEEDAAVQEKSGSEGVPATAEGSAEGTAGKKKKKKKKKKKAGSTTVEEEAEEEVDDEKSVLDEDTIEEEKQDEATEPPTPVPTPPVAVEKPAAPEPVKETPPVNTPPAVEDKKVEAPIAPVDKPKEPEKKEAVPAPIETKKDVLSTRASTSTSPLATSPPGLAPSAVSMERRSLSLMEKMAEKTTPSMPPGFRTTENIGSPTSSASAKPPPGLNNQTTVSLERKPSMPPPGLGAPPGLSMGTRAGPPGLSATAGPPGLGSSGGPPGLGKPARMLPPGLEMARTTSAPGGPSSISSSKGPAIIRSPEKLGNIQYPPNIKSPFADAGANSPSSNMFKYDRGFLMQFMDVCKDKPTNMPSDALDETKGDLARTPSGRRGGGSGRQSLPPRSGMFSPSDMAKMTSEERFAASASANLRQGAGLGRSFSQTGEVRRTPSGGKGLPPKEMERDNRRGGKSGRGRGRGGKGERESHGGPTIPMDQVVPLEKSESAWKVEKTKAAAEAENSPVVVQRKIKALLNKLTLEKFDTISDKIMEFANMSRNEEDGSTLKLVIQLVFEKATDEPNFSSMYAKLAKKMLDDMSDDVVDTSLFGKDGKPLAGGTLFRKYLLNRCQEEFEKGWKVDLPTDPSVDELMSDEYYIAMKAKRRGLGLIQFIGELFKLEMLTERIMHECVRRLLSNVNDPEEEETESLCRLMITVGERLDHVQAKGFMDVYFNRIRDLSTNKKLSSRIRFMLLDLIDMRSNNWVARREAAGPKTIAEIHDEAAKAKEAQDALRRSQSSSGRGMPPMNQQYSNYGSNRPRKDSSVNDKGRPGSMGIPSEWTSVGQTQATPTQAARKPSDMSKFGMLERTKSETASSNPFEALGGGSKGWTDKSAEKKDAAITPKTILKPGGPPGLASAKSGPPGMAVNKFGALNLQSPDSEEPRSDGRPQLKLAPRTVQQAQPVSETKVTKQTVKKKTDEALKEYYSVKDVEELRRCLLELGSPEYMQDAISQMMTVVEKSPADVKAIATAFDRFQKDETVKADVFAKAFEENMLNFVDLEIDVPNMYKYVAQLLVASNIKTKTVQELTQNLPNPGTAKHAAATIFVEYIKLVRESSGEEGLMRRFRFPTVNLRFLFPTSDEYYADFLENNNLFALASGMKAFKPLKKMIVSEPHEVIMKWLDDNVAGPTVADDVARVVCGTIYRHVALLTIFPNGINKPAVAITPDIEKKERDLLERHEGFFGKYVPTLKGHVAVATAAAFADSQNYPTGWFARTLTNLYELKLVDKSAIIKWKHEAIKTDPKAFAQVEDVIKSIDA